MKHELPGIISRRRLVSTDDIVTFYKDRHSKLPSHPIFDPRNITLTNTPTGLGDCVILTRHIRDGGFAWSPSNHFKPLADHIPGYLDQQTALWMSICAAGSSWDCGPGHNIQRIQRLFGQSVSLIPRGYLPGLDKDKHKGRVIVHFEAGHHSIFQQRYHKKPRQVYPPNLEIIRKFFLSHPEYDVWEVGSKPILGEPAIDFTGRGLLETIKVMERAEWHLGIISGPYHLAEAMGLKTIAIINLPKPWQLMLPTMVSTGVVEEEWIYPQSMVLHQDEDSLHWPKFSLATLSAAFNHEVYPYGRAGEFCELIH